MGLICLRNCFFVFWYVLSIILSLCLVGIIVTVIVIFGGLPPTYEYVQGGQGLLVSQSATIIGCIMSIVVVFCCKFSFRPVKCCGCIFIIIVYILFGFSFFFGIYAAHAFRDLEPTPEKISQYTKDYYKDNKKPPPFLDFIQTKFDGYCCGGKGLGDYGEFSYDVPFINVPKSCCSPQARKNLADNVQGNASGGDIVTIVDVAICGKESWSPFLLIVEEAVGETIKRLDGGPDKDEPDFMKVFIKQVKLTAKKAFMDDETKIEERMRKRFAEYFKTANAKITKEAQTKYPNDPVQQAQYIAQRIQEETVKFVEAQEKLFDSEEAIKNYLLCVPYGCGSLLHFGVHGKWRRFDKFQKARDYYLLATDSMYALVITTLVVTLVDMIIFTLVLIFPGKKDEDDDDDDDDDDDIKSPDNDDD